MAFNYPNLDPSDKSFVTMNGGPGACEDGIDHVWESFLTLRHVIATALWKMFPLTGFRAEGDFEEMGIASQVRWITVLVCTHCRELDFDLGTQDPIESWREIAAQCMRSEEWWRAVVALDRREPNCTGEDGVHSSVASNHKNLGWNGPNLFDVGDYIRTCESYVDDYFRYAESAVGLPTGNASNECQHRTQSNTSRTREVRMEATVEYQLTEAQKRAAVLLAQGLPATEVGRRVQKDEHTIGRWKKEAAFADAVKAAGDALDEQALAEVAEFNAELRKLKREALRTLRNLLESKEPADRLRAVDIALKA